MHSKGTSVGLETQDVVAYFLEMSKDLSVGEMLGGLLCHVNVNIHYIILSTM
jgi:hypothetical protein